MGLRFRRSKKIGPLRINLSGSGVGWSIGGKHFRYTQPAKGKAYTTTTIPGTGISSRNTVQSSAQVGDQIRNDPAPAETKKSGGLAVPIVIGVILAFLILAGMQFVGDLSGYTRENMIPPPPDRTAQMAATAETESSVMAAPEPHETTVSLSAPEAVEVTAPAETAPASSDLPAEIIPLKPEPAETTLEEWFALVEARAQPRKVETEERLEGETTFDEWVEAHKDDTVGRMYTVNTSTHKIHEKDDCPAAKQIKPENLDFTDDPYTLIAEGYTWCGTCHKTP